MEENNNTPKTRKKGNTGAHLRDNPNRVVCSGPRVNYPATVRFSSKKYKLPGDLEIGKPMLDIRTADLQDRVRNGANWEDLEWHYLVSQTNLKEHFELAYNQAQAQLRMTLKKDMIENKAQQKWLSQQFLGMKESPTTTNPGEQLTEEQINEQLSAIFNKLKP